MPAESGSVPVRAATGNDIPALSRLLAEAFHHNAVVSWMIPREKARRRILPHLYAAMLRREYLARGVVDVVEANGVVVGAALWNVPGAAPSSTSEQLRQLPETLSILRLEALTSARRFGAVASLEQRRPRQPHWYFANLAVHPDVQRRGISRALMHAGLRRADASRRPTYGDLTAPYFAGRLQAAGFRLLDPVELSGAPPVRPVWRPVPEDLAPDEIEC